jgi:putative hemolysin
LYVENVICDFEDLILKKCKNNETCDNLFLKISHIRRMQKSDTDEMSLIDVKKVFMEKNPKLGGMLPAFVFRYIENLIHQQECNDILIKSKGMRGIEFARMVVEDVGVAVKTFGKENILPTGNIIVASNHPLGGIDGMALISEFGKIRRDFKFIVNDILLKIKPLEDVFVGVNKHGSNPRKGLETIEKLYASDEAVLVYPAGLVSRKQKGIIMDLPWQKSYLNKALKYKSPVVPTFIEGKNTERFYNIANLRKIFGIKANLEMMFLPDELFKQKGKAINIIFGKPIDPVILKKMGNPAFVAEAMKHFVYTLPANPEGNFEPFFHQYLLQNEQLITSKK